MTDLSLEAHVVSDPGWRARMEDRHYLAWGRDWVVGAIFDGHAGDAVAEFAATRFGALRERSPGEALREIHRQARSLPGGACAVAFRLQGERLEVANVGDAALVLYREEKVEVLTETHRLDNPAERRRVLACGALVRGPYLVDPATGNGLMPTRALGDREFAHLGVIGEPYERTTSFRRGWLVAACDGLWDVMRPGEVAGFLQGSARSAAERLAAEALHFRGCTDNLTLIVVRRLPAAEGPPAESPEKAEG